MTTISELLLLQQAVLRNERVEETLGAIIRRRLVCPECHNADPDACVRCLTDASSLAASDEERHCDGCGEDYDAFAESHAGHDPAP